MTCRAASGSATCAAGSTPTGNQLGYDAEGRLTSWQNTPTSPSTTDGFLYDGEGNRVEQQVTSGLPSSPSTTTTVYVGNLEEVATTSSQGSGNSTSTTTYYYAGTQRIAEAVNGTVSYLATDALGSTTVAFTASGTPLGQQLYAPYGTVRYASGTLPTDYGYTGQHSDATTGLDYYNARYYDPIAAQFTSADSLLPGKGFDLWGLSRYAYVEGDPTVKVDPTGHDGLFGALVSVVASTVSAVAQVAQAVAPAAGAVLDATTGIPSMISDVQTIFSGNASTLDKILAGGDLLLNVVMDATMVIGVGEGLKAASVGLKAAAHVAEDVGAHAVEHAGEDAVEHVAAHEAEDGAEHVAEDGAEAAAGDCLSFAAATLVATPSGERAIASVQPGDNVSAYDPATGKRSTQTVAATSLHRDDNLVDVTLRVVVPAVPAVLSKSVTATKTTQTATSGMGTAGQGATAATATTTTTTTTTTKAATVSTTREETIATTTNHPWLTADAGWLPAGFLRIGEPVQELDGATAVVVSVRAVPGSAVMWDLTVNNLHTFAVGDGQFVVHNCPRKVDWEQGEDSSGGRGPDRLRGRDAKSIDSNVAKAARRMKMSPPERRGFGRYIEDRKAEAGMPNDGTFGWQDLMHHAEDYLREIRGQD